MWLSETGIVKLIVYTSILHKYMNIQVILYLFKCLASNVMITRFGLATSQCKSSRWRHILVYNINIPGKKSIWSRKWECKEKCKLQQNRTQTGDTGPCGKSTLKLLAFIVRPILMEPDTVVKYVSKWRRHRI